METSTEKKTDAYALKISFSENGARIAWAYVYILNNELHKEPFGFLENVFVEEAYRGKGLGSRLVKEAIAAAKKAGCYKLIGTSRDSKPEVHRFYERLGFKKHGAEFRMDF